MEKTDRNFLKDRNKIMPDNQHGSQLISGLNSEESFLEAATYPVRFLLKFYETTMMEMETKEITVQPSKARATWTRADVNNSKTVIVREPSTSEFGFQELPVRKSELHSKRAPKINIQEICIL